MMHKNNYLLRIYESHTLKNKILMELEDFTQNKDLTCGIGRTTLPFGYNIFDSDFFHHYLSDIDEISESFYRFICSQFNFVPLPEYLFKDIDEKTYRSMSMGLEYRNDLSVKEKYEYFLKNEKQSEKTVNYYCDTEIELSLSELHYYILNGYKRTYCNLCGKPFFTKNLKNKYCQRKGFDNIHPEYSCNKIKALQRNIKCASTPLKEKRKIIRSTLARTKAGIDYTNDKLSQFNKEDEEYKSSHLPSEYEQWIDEMYKQYVPNGKKLTKII